MSGFWVAETDAKTGGVVAGMVGIERLSDDEAEVRRMYVDAGRRRQGIGSRLLAHAEDFCAGAGYTCIVLRTSALQEAAKALYEARGTGADRRLAEARTSRRWVLPGVTRDNLSKLICSSPRCA